MIKKTFLIQYLNKTKYATTGKTAYALLMTMTLKIKPMSLSFELGNTKSHIRQTIPPNYINTICLN